MTGESKLEGARGELRVFDTFFTDNVNHREGLSTFSAFGVYFEWNKTPGNTVSVHISDSEDESVEDDEETTETDVEAVKPPAEPEPPSSIIIPVYRRDSHQEVYVGRHQYPGQGIYLLKFDNSYSLWRGKTLYYRVYYTR